MSRYHFEIQDGLDGTPDAEGQEFADLASVRREAIAVLADLARDTLPRDGDRHDIIVNVRDSAGMMVYTATLSLIGRWLG